MTVSSRRHCRIHSADTKAPKQELSKAKAEYLPFISIQKDPDIMMVGVETSPRLNAYLEKFGRHHNFRFSSLSVAKQLAWVPSVKAKDSSSLLVHEAARALCRIWEL
jgi:hypothetical protein